jgi:hypothetical protein
MKFTPPMIRAFLILSLLTIIMTGMEYMRYETSLATKVIYFFITVFDAAFIVAMINSLCRKPLADFSDAVAGTGFNTWGYLWRSFISYFSFIPLWTLLVTIIPLNFPDRGDYDSRTLLLMLPIAMACWTFAIWLLFSRNRLGQIKFLLRMT